MKRLISAFAFFVFACPLFAQGPSKVTVADQLVKPDGSYDSGTITITSAQTFTSPDSFVVPIGQRVTVTLSATGTFSIALIPNIGATPANTYYTADYYTATKRFTELWIVPQSSTTINLLAVRALSPPVPSIFIPFSQINPPVNCATPLVLRYIGPSSGFVCAPDNLGIVTMNLENPTPADAGKFQWKPKNPLTFTRITCSTDVGTATVSLEARSESLPNTTGTPVVIIPFVCTPTTTIVTAFTNPVVPTNSPVALIVWAINGTPGVVRVHAEYQLN